MCTTFVFKNRHDLVVGNNEDTFMDKGMVFTNQRDIIKEAFIMPPEEPVKWVSKYGSITFSQVGKEFPSAGMNETGLVIEQMTLPETKYPEPDNRPAIQDIQLIQYILDTCSSTGQVMKCITQLRISQSNSRIHYLICDQNGDTAVLEYLNGELQICCGENMLVPVLANSSYYESLQYNSAAKDITAINNIYQRNSIDRFTKAVGLVQTLPLETLSLVDYAFEALHAVSRDDTVWNVVYRPKSRTIYFKTRQQPRIKNISTTDFDFADRYPAKAININCSWSENLPDDFNNYCFKINRELAESFFNNETIKSLFRLDINDEMLDYFASYPERFTIRRTDMEGV